jgi:hypothetical protein
VELLNAHADKIIAVCGNCDSEVDQMLLHFPLMADYAQVLADGKRIFLTRASLLLRGFAAASRRKRLSARTYPYSRNSPLLRRHHGIQPWLYRLAQTRQSTHLRSLGQRQTFPSSAGHGRTFRSIRHYR